MIFTRAMLQGRAGDPAAILAEMERITRAREESQPIREKTGGSTFKNPPGEKAWRLIDQAGCRGLASATPRSRPMHCNFLINRGEATAADIEALGEEVRRRVRETSGVALEWEIKRIGAAGPGYYAMMSPALVARSEATKRLGGVSSARCFARDDGSCAVADGSVNASLRPRRLILA